jgi:hypothetical protein
VTTSGSSAHPSQAARDALTSLIMRTDTMLSGAFTLRGGEWAIRIAVTKGADLVSMPNEIMGFQVEYHESGPFSADEAHGQEAT